MMTTDARIEKGKAIAANHQVRHSPDGTWIVLSQSRPKAKYVVILDPQEPHCTCPDFETWEMVCKHIYAVRFHQSIEAGVEDSTSPMAQPRQQYPQVWAAYNAAQIHEREEFELLLKDLCSGIPQPRQEKGRPRLALADVIYASAMKVYTTMSGRRASTDIRSAEAKGMIDHAPHHNSISHYLCMKELTPILKRLVEISASPLKAVETQFAIDATGFSTCVYDRWFDHKYGRNTRQQRWIKCHAMVGTKTNVVTSIEVTSGHVADTVMLPDLVARTAANFNMQEVSADKGYLSNQNLMTVEAHGAVPFVPFKIDSTGTGTSAWQKLWHLFWFKRDEFLQHYHRRSNVESTFSAIKRKFGGAVRSKHFEAQVNEVLLKVLVFNITMVIHEMHELGIQADFGISIASN